jgi:tRNA(fMet)-specific endonuclease VapC
VIILDSDILSIIQRGQGAEYENLIDRLDLASEDVAVSIISFEEQMRGWLAFIAKAQGATQQVVAYAKLRALLHDFGTRPVLDFDQAAANQFERLRRSRVRIGTMDLRIAAIALANNALLLSRNLVDFRKVPGLRVDDWIIS